MELMLGCRGSNQTQQGNSSAFVCCIIVASFPGETESQQTTTQSTQLSPSTTGEQQGRQQTRGVLPGLITAHDLEQTLWHLFADADSCGVSRIHLASTGLGTTR
jgi:hypothetical protein